MKNVLTIIAILIIESCSMKFKNVKFPLEREVNCDVIIANISSQAFTGIYIVDSLLIFQDVRANEKFIKYYNINNGEIVTEFGQIGKGPNQLITPYIANVDKIERKIYLYDPNLRIMHKFDIAKFSDSPDEIYRLKDQSNDNTITSRIFYATQPVDKRIFGNGLFKDGYITAANFETQQVEYFGNFPLKTTKSNNLNIADACSNNLRVTPDKNHLIVTTNRFGYVACYQINIPSPKLIWEINLSKALFSTEGQRIIFSRNNKIGVMSMAVTNDKIFLLYQGTEFRYYTSSDTQFYPHTVMVFSINGKPLALYHLDRPAIRIDVDENENIYCISQDPEYNLVKLRL